MVIVDTSIWIEFFRRNGDPAAKLALGHLIKNREASFCGPVKMELLGGVSASRQQAFAQKLKLFPTVPEKSDFWIQSAGNYSQLRSAGVTAPWNDILISTIARHSGFRIYAADNHFAIMAPILGLQLYTPGPGGTFQPESL